MVKRICTKNFCEKSGWVW